MIRSTSLVLSALAGGLLVAAPRAYAHVMRREVIGGPLDKQLIYVAHSIWKGALVDEFAATARRSIRCWCLEVDPA